MLTEPYRSEILMAAVYNAATGQRPTPKPYAADLSSPSEKLQFNFQLISITIKNRIRRDKVKGMSLQKEKKKKT